MANLTLQVTIPASGVVNLATALPVLSSGQTPMTVSGTMYVEFLQFQNNAAHPIRFGTDRNVSVTTPAAVNGGTAGRGILLAAGSPGGAGSVSTPVTYATMLQDWYVAGVPGDVIDILALQ